MKTREIYTKLTERKAEYESLRCAYAAAQLRHLSSWASFL